MHMGYYSNACQGRRGKEVTAESDFIIEDDYYNKGCSRTLGKTN